MKKLISRTIWFFIPFLFTLSNGYGQVHNLGDTGGGFGWFKLGTLTMPQGGADASISIVSGNGYNAAQTQQGECFVHFRTSNGNSESAGFYGSGSYYNTGRTKLVTGMRVVQIGQYTWDFYANLPSYTGAGAVLNLASSLGTWSGNLVYTALPVNVIYTDLTEESFVQSNAVFVANVGIGTADNQGYKLAVNGNAIAESVTVKLHATWPDYVFKKSYRQTSLTDLEAFIKKNKHLPEIPDAADVKKNGIDLGEINAKLLKKIEELTLYIIDKDKQLNQQEAKIKAQDDRMDKFEALVKDLQKKQN